MKLAYQDPLTTLYLGNCMEVMAAMPENSVDAIVTDPPYGLEFMGKEWDKIGGQDFHRRWAEQAYRVLKPGGHLLALVVVAAVCALAVAVNFVLGRAAKRA